MRQDVSVSSGNILSEAPTLNSLIKLISGWGTSMNLSDKRFDSQEGLVLLDIQSINERLDIFPLILR